MREFIVPLPQHPKKYSAIPAKAGIHPIIRHSRKGRSPSHHPSFPRRRESTIPRIIRHYPQRPGILTFPRMREFIVPLPQRHSPEKILCPITPTPCHPQSPAKAGIHPIIRHSRKGRNPPHHPSFPRMREFNEKKHHPDQPDTSFPHRTTFNVIPAKAGVHPIIRHSREGGNPQFPRMREFIVPLLQHPKKYSVIPAKAGIHPIIRHSREGGNPQFPRMREFIVPLPQHPKRWGRIAKVCDIGIKFNLS